MTEQQLREAQQAQIADAQQKLEQERLAYMLAHGGSLPPLEMIAPVSFEDRLLEIEADRMNLLRKGGRRRERLRGFWDMVAADIPWLIRELREAKANAR